MYQQAQALETETRYGQAIALYNQALTLFLEEGDDESAYECGEAARKLSIIQLTYPWTLEQLKQLIRDAYPHATDEQIESWTSGENVQQTQYDGEAHYFSDAVANLKYRHMDLMHADEVVQQAYHDLVGNINSIAQTEPALPWAQYHNPATYRGTHTISIPREELPKTGTIRVWLPIPINNGPQTGVTVDSISPEKWLKLPPSVDQDIGLVYMEVPMEELEEDLFIEVCFTFTHYEQRFAVDPSNIGEYDTDSDLYKSYTSPYGNTEINTEIREMAHSVVGDESNPYHAARKIYDYIVENVTYSFMPHFVFWPRTELTESTYVHRYQWGDCGAQSMYFSAMCRALGIPARTTGGWQLFSGEFSGHFWAEFYLPNYGWVPVDTSAAQAELYLKDIGDAQRRTFIDYFFANQDSMRCVVQKDTDVPLIPRVGNSVLLPMAIQTPAVEYSLPTSEILDEVILDHWTMQCVRIE
ncbi:MAG: transglutaminase domain-containing protein [Lentisphaerae bacterium]|nr:transglutaminase domain-containing protein [Lentisphaerota bacterium]